jgi:hypothetical protein
MRRVFLMIFGLYVAILCVMVVMMWVREWQNGHRGIALLYASLTVGLTLYFNRGRWRAPNG